MDTYADVLQRELKRRLQKLERLEKALNCVDDQDWDYLLSLIKQDGGRDRFWKTVIDNTRQAMKADVVEFLTSLDNDVVDEPEYHRQFDD